ncbi:uncharacterized protein LOC122662365 [Telopea speciosissima]|uniref:uncharacterized protein LOC122662365 n=1 Tax=Telopea speciosissima TaxID=54955 RepID=UPI001CC4EBA5|nr:uncharacterized protein LOC122662365 [Telopea speciosissima]
MIFLILRVDQDVINKNNGLTGSTLELCGLILFGKSLPLQMLLGFGAKSSLRSTALKAIQSKIGDGSSTALWLDYLHPKGILIHSVSNRAIYNSGLSRQSKVADILSNGDWCPPSTTHPGLLEAWNALPSIPRRTGRCDCVSWTPSPLGIFKLKDAWNLVRIRSDLVPWRKLAWFEGHIPRHSFTVWRVFNNCLPTQSFLRHRQIPVSPSCSLCWNATEDTDHLFFDCSLSSAIWKGILGKCWPRSRRILPFSREWLWIDMTFLGSTLCDIVGKLAFCATINQIWMECNIRKWTSNSRTVGQIWESISFDIKGKLTNVTSRCIDSPRNRHIVVSWDLPRSSL